MRRSAVATVAAAGLVAGAAATGTAVASANSTPDLTRSRTIRLVDRSGPATYIDNGKKGPSQGDMIVIRDALVRANGKRAGHGIGTLTQNSTGGPQAARIDFALTYTAVLADGDITVQGDITSFENGKSYELAVTGGTGAYGNARGTVVAHQVNDSDTALTFRLIP